MSNSESILAVNSDIKKSDTVRKLLVNIKVLTLKDITRHLVNTLESSTVMCAWN